MTATASDTSGWNAAPSRRCGLTSVVIAPAVKPAGKRMISAGIFSRLASTWEPTARTRMRPTPISTWLAVTDRASSRRTRPPPARRSGRPTAGPASATATVTRAPPGACRNPGTRQRRARRNRAGADRSMPGLVRYHGESATDAGSGSPPVPPLHGPLPHRRRHLPPPPPPAGMRIVVLRYGTVVRRGSHAEPSHADGVPGMPRFPGDAGHRPAGVMLPAPWPPDAGSWHRNVDGGLHDTRAA